MYPLQTLVSDFSVPVEEEACSEQNFRTLLISWPQKETQVASTYTTAHKNNILTILLQILITQISTITLMGVHTLKGGPKKQQLVSKK